MSEYTLYNGAYSGPQVDAAVSRALSGGAIDAEIATIRSQVSNPFVIAATASDMTEHTKAYVYTGSEAGYVTGGWYYWNGSNWTLGGTAVDSTLTVSGAAADAKSVGDKFALCVRSGSTTLIINDTQAASLLSGDANTPAINTIYGIGNIGLAIANLPGGASYATGNLFTLGFRAGNLNGKTQFYVTYTGKMYLRTYRSNAWSAWTAVLDENNSLTTNTMILSAETAQSMFSADFDNLAVNKIYCIGTPGLTIANMPYSNFYGDVLSFNFRDTSSTAGRMQIAVSNSNTIYTRINFGGSWKAWTKLASEETVYYVGPTRANTSLVALLKTIQTDTSPNVIYMDEGEYDIYQEYRENNIPSPPANVETWDYFQYNVFLPQNTRLVGIGNVVLNWSPAAGDITAAESKTWSPLNLWYGGNTVENITIRCKNGRYCIHDDSHNAFTGFTQVYRNVRCVCTQSDTGLGFNSVIGMGFEDKCNFIFEDCHFEFIGSSPASVFYGHDGNSGGASIICRNTVLLGGGANTIKLQSLRTDDSNRILTRFDSCYVDGGIHLNQYNSSAGQFFDVTLLRSGNPAQTVDIADNPYPIKVYQ